MGSNPAIPTNLSNAFPPHTDQLATRLHRSRYEPSHSEKPSVAVAGHVACTTDGRGPVGGCGEAGAMKYGLAWLLGVPFSLVVLWFLMNQIGCGS